MPDASQITTQDAATAALLWVAALNRRLIEKNILSFAEASDIGATAAAMCRAHSAPHGGDLIEAIFPAAKGATTPILQ
jgi:hypothetical protein